LALSPPAVEGLENITIGSTVAGLLTLALFLLLSRLSWRFLEFNFLPEAGANAALAHATATLLAYVIIILGAIVALGMAGVNFTTVTVIVGGLSIGLGFGLQQIASNFVSGFILMFERSIGRGDVIEVSGQMGVVQNVGIRSIIIRTHTNREIIIPNAYFLSDMMTNLTRSDRAIRVDIEVGVTYQANPLEVEQALLEAAQHPSILEDPPPAVQFRDFGDSSLDFALLAWTDDPMGIPKLASELHYQVWDALQNRNIEIPYPQRDIHIRTGKSRI
jgi:small-conductance mechanosensitive channel